jgi:type IV pilus assembly protein PilY1
MVTKIAAISSTADTDVANKRKFLFPPDVVFGMDGNGNYSAILLGSGDREHPFDATVRNSFYMFKDRDDTSGLAPKEGAPNSTSVRIDMTGFTPPSTVPITDADVFDATNVVVDSTNTLSLNGWRIDLATGEKVVSSAVTIGGTTYFNTNQPDAVAGGGNCDSNLGIAREYLVGFADAAATTDINGGGITMADRSTIHKGGGYLPSPVPVVVEIDGRRYQAVISGTSVQTPPGVTLEARTRAYWYKEIE